MKQNILRNKKSALVQQLIKLREENKAVKQNIGKMEQAQKETIERMKAESANEASIQAARRENIFNQQKLEQGRIAQHKVQMTLDQVQSQYVQAEEHARQQLAQQSAVIRQQAMQFEQVRQHAEAATAAAAQHSSGIAYW
jgi:hypothetical protein